MDRCYYDELQIAFDKSCWQKKTTNITISLVIVVLGVSSFLFGLRLESISTIFRWMTVDGTVFTTIGAYGGEDDQSPQEQVDDQGGSIGVDVLLFHGDPSL